MEKEKRKIILKRKDEPDYRNKSYLVIRKCIFAKNVSRNNGI